MNRTRWIILALLFAGTTINYMDRIVLSVLLPVIKEDIHITPIAYGYITGAFQFTYTIGLLLFGLVIDRFGTKLGYLISILLWSITGALHGLCGSGWCLAGNRAAFGLAASGNFPAAIKSVAEWFKIEDRSFATSLFNAGSSISSIIGPPLIALVAIAFGWRWGFILFGGIGFFLALFWGIFYKTPNMHQAVAGAATEKPSWSQLLKHKQMLGIMIGKFLTDPVWWFYLFWMPNYLNTQRGFDLKGIAVAVPLIYAIATLMGFIGGWLPGFWIRRGLSVDKARKRIMLISALFLPVTSLAVFAVNPWLAILLVALACGAHSSWSANIFTLCSDCFPARAVGSVTGLAGFAGGLGSILLSALVPGFVVQYFGYAPIFILMGILHPLAFMFIKYFVTSNARIAGVQL